MIILSFAYLVVLAVTLRRVPTADLAEIHRQAVGLKHELELAVIAREFERRSQPNRGRVEQPRFG